MAKDGAAHRTRAQDAAVNQRVPLIVVAVTPSLLAGATPMGGLIGPAEEYFAGSHSFRRNAPMTIGDGPVAIALIVL